MRANVNTGNLVPSELPEQLEQTAQSKQQARYIWFTDGDYSRNPFGAFRKVFVLPCAEDAADDTNTTDITKAVFSIFADTAYRLCVNGQYVGFGPVRFDPHHPVYDCYDLRPFLKSGENVITVLVNFQNQKTFKSIPVQAALIAWGQVTYDLKTNTQTTTVSIDLTTGSTPWKGRQHTGYAHDAPKLSFALGSREVFDHAVFDADWEQPGYNDDLWPDAVVLSDVSAFGALTARSIPFMSLTPVSPTAPVRLLPHIPLEKCYSFQLSAPYTYTTAFDPQDAYSKRIYWSTYIYSPRDQVVTAGVLYEELWLNGQACAIKQEEPYRPLRFTYSLSLKQGWNYLFAQMDVIQDIYECYLALPTDCGLMLSADKDASSGRLFRHTRIQPIEKDAALHACIAPWSEDATATAFGGWVYTTDADRAQSPCREISWDIYGSPIDRAADTLQNGIISKDAYPHGVTLLIDLGHMRLVMPHIALQGVAGTTVDVLYGDRFTADGMHLRSLPWVPLGDRIACGGQHQRLDWTPVQPRGCRYLSIAIRNAPGDVVIESIGFRSAQYPVTRLGHFTCSDPLLNRIWEMGALTQSINMEDAYDDCVDRERGLYALDTLIQYHVNLACYGDHALMRRSLELYAQSVHEIGLFRCVYPNSGHYIIPDFALYVVDAFYCYYRYTGDSDFVAGYWDIIMTNLRVFMRLSDERADGLLNAEPPEKDWPKVTSISASDHRTGFWGDHDRMDNTGVNCIFSSVYLIALRSAAALAAVLGHTGEAEALNKRIAVLEISIPQAFFDASRGLFADNMDKQCFSPHASLFAARAGAVPSSVRPLLQAALPKRLTPFFANGYNPADGYAFGTHMAFYFLDALYALDLPEAAENCIRSGWMWFLTQGLPTTPEHFDLSSSQCHAWSASPTYMLSRHALGVHFDCENGLDQVQVTVNAGSLDWAKGAFPHPKGVINIAWHKENGRVIIDQAEAPEGVCITYTNAGDQ